MEHIVLTVSSIWKMGKKPNPSVCQFNKSTFISNIIISFKKHPYKKVTKREDKRTNPVKGEKNSLSRRQDFQQQFKPRNKEIIR